jgi:hypothetical protein
MRTVGISLLPERTQQFLEADEQELRRLLAPDRYERYAHTKRRRASVKLADVSAAE